MTKLHRLRSQDYVGISLVYQRGAWASDSSRISQQQPLRISYSHCYLYIPWVSSTYSVLSCMLSIVQTVIVLTHDPCFYEHVVSHKIGSQLLLVDTHCPKGNPLFIQCSFTVHPLLIFHPLFIYCSIGHPTNFVLVSVTYNTVVSLCVEFITIFELKEFVLMKAYRFLRSGWLSDWFKMIVARGGRGRYRVVMRQRAGVSPSSHGT